jgi:hypothetical protein
VGTHCHWWCGWHWLGHTGSAGAVFRIMWGEFKIMLHKGKKYARLDHYGNLLVPVSLLEKIVSQCYIADVSWQDDGYQITKVARIEQVKIHDGTEIDLVLAEQALNGDSR